MFEVETENLINVIKSKTISFEKNIKLNQLLESSIPKSIKNYFYLEAEALLNQENYFRIDKDRFDVTSNEVKKTLIGFDEILKMNCIFQRNEFILLLEKAVSFQFNYLSKPRWTLTKFVYKESNSKSVEEITALMRYFIDYSYYNDILIGYLNKKDIKRILISDFDKLIKKIDASLIKRYSAHEIAAMPKPLLDYINFSNSIKSKNLDIASLILFFEDKELFGITSALNLEKEVRGKNNITIDDLSFLIEKLDDLRKPDFDRNAYSQSGSVIEKNEGVVKDLLDKKYILKPQLLEKSDYLAPEGNKIPVDETSSSVSGEVVREPEKIIDIINNISLESEYKEENGSDVVNNENNIKTQNSEKSKVTAIIDDFDYEFTIISGSQAPDKQKNVVFYIEEDDEKLFIKKLFNKSEGAYKEAINDLSKCRDWKEAASYIDNFFIRSDINPYSNTAINFTDKIQIGFLKHNVH
jgi:hypothetical protein